jgi:hypothetical protein
MRRVALVFVLILSGACGDHGDHGDEAPSALEESATEAVAGICSALEADPEAARTAFQSVHGQLHDIGDALTEQDRAEAADFLRAKTTVEADISGDAPADKLKADLTALSEAIDRALTKLDVETSGC